MTEKEILLFEKMKSNFHECIQVWVSIQSVVIFSVNNNKIFVTGRET